MIPNMVMLVLQVLSNWFYSPNQRGGYCYAMLWGNDLYDLHILEANNIFFTCMSLSPNTNILPSSSFYWSQHQVQQPLMCGYRDRHTSIRARVVLKLSCSIQMFPTIASEYTYIWDVRSKWCLWFSTPVQCSFCILNTVAVYKWLFWLFSKGGSVIYTLSIIQSVL